MMVRVVATWFLFMFLASIQASCGGGGSGHAPADDTPPADVRAEVPQTAPAPPENLHSGIPASLAEIRPEYAALYASIFPRSLNILNRIATSTATRFGQGYTPPFSPVAEKVTHEGAYGGELTVTRRADEVGNGFEIRDFKDYRPEPDVTISGRKVTRVSGRNMSGNNFTQVISFRDYREVRSGQVFELHGSVRQPSRLAETEFKNCCSEPARRTADLDLEVGNGVQGEVLHLINVSVAVGDVEPVDTWLQTNSQEDERSRLWMHGEFATANTAGRFILDPGESSYLYDVEWPSANQMLKRIDTLVLEGAEIHGRTTVPSARIRYLNPFFHVLGFDMDGDSRYELSARVETAEGRLDTGSVIGLKNVLADAAFGIAHLGDSWYRSSDTYLYALGEDIKLDGRTSLSPNGMPLRFEWRLLQVPEGSDVSIENSNMPETRLVPDVPGRYLVKLKVDDGSQRDSTVIALDVMHPDNIWSHVSYIGIPHEQQTRISVNGNAVIDHRPGRLVPDHRLPAGVLNLSFLGKFFGASYDRPGDEIGVRPGGPDNTSGSVSESGYLYHYTGPSTAPRFSAPVKIDFGLQGTRVESYVRFRQFGDFNGDGILDMGTTPFNPTEYGSGIHVTLRLSDGSLDHAGRIDVGNGEGFQFSDMDADGETDLLVSDYKKIHVLWRGSDGSFDVSNRTELIVPHEYVFRPFVEDGNTRPSVLVGSRSITDETVTVSVYRPMSGRSFHEPITNVVHAPYWLGQIGEEFFADIDGNSYPDLVHVIRRTARLGPGDLYQQTGIRVLANGAEGFASAIEDSWFPRGTDIGVHFNSWDRDTEAESIYLTQATGYQPLNEALEWSHASAVWLDVGTDRAVLEETKDLAMKLFAVLPDISDGHPGTPFFCHGVTDRTDASGLYDEGSLSAFGTTLYGSYPCPMERTLPDFMREDRLRRTFFEDVDGNGWEDLLTVGPGGYYVIFRYAPFADSPAETE